MGVGSISFVGLNGCTTRISSRPRTASACSCVKIICSQKWKLLLLTAIMCIVNGSQGFQLACAISSSQSHGCTSTYFSSQEHCNQHEWCLPLIVYSVLPIWARKILKWQSILKIQNQGKKIMSSQNPPEEYYGQ